MDYEEILFRCHRCHQYGHVEKQCHLTFKISFEKSRKRPVELEGKILEKDGYYFRTWIILLIVRYLLWLPIIYHWYSNIFIYFQNIILNANSILNGCMNMITLWTLYIHKFSYFFVVSMFIMFSDLQVPCFDLWGITEIDVINAWGFTSSYPNYST